MPEFSAVAPSVFSLISGLLPWLSLGSNPTSPFHSPPVSRSSSPPVGSSQRPTSSHRRSPSPSFPGSHLPFVFRSSNNDPTPPVYTSVPPGTPLVPLPSEDWSTGPIAHHVVFNPNSLHIPPGHFVQLNYTTPDFCRVLVEERDVRREVALVEFDQDIALVSHPHLHGQSDRPILPPGHYLLNGPFEFRIP
jgi:hypothetical protein